MTRVRITGRPNGGLDPLLGERVRDDQGGFVPRPRPGFARRDATQVDTVRGPALMGTVLAQGGQPLPAAAAAASGHSFADVRIHAGADAARSAAALGARAYTSGRHVVFGAGEYAPETVAGAQVLRHELIHVAQQRSDPMLTGAAPTSIEDQDGPLEREARRPAGQSAGADRPLDPRRVGPLRSSGRAVVQRLIREPYPWLGVITPVIGANVRTAPAVDPANLLLAVPRGERVKVLGVTGDWLHVETRYRGPAESGYVHHRLVDDAAASEMAGSVGTTMVWRPSGPGSGTDFEAWASAATETPFPPVTATTVMNCWEAVLLAAYRARTLNWAQIHHIYLSPMATWVASMARGAVRTYAVPGPNPRMPQRGDLVFFDGLAHVGMATGNGSEVYTFWPPPSTPFVPGGTPDKVKVFTIEALVAWWTANLPPAPVVTFAAPRW